MPVEKSCKRYYRKCRSSPSSAYPNTARETWEQHESFLQEYLWGGGFWEESYYVETTGDLSSDTIEQYSERTNPI